MLRGLEIRDILIIDRLEIAFQPGLNVLTGETGAGKSILLDALGFVLGWRGRADLVRVGAAQGEVTAVFSLSPDHPARAVLRDADLPEDDELVLRRTNAPDGRKSARVNDRRVSGDVLRRLSDTLVELHGQHDDRGLLDARGHGALLDAFGGYGDALLQTKQSWHRLRTAQQAQMTLAEALARARVEEEALRHNLAELRALDPQTGEEAELDAMRRRMQAADRLRDDILKAAALLAGDDAQGQGPQAALATAIRWLEPVAPELDGALDDPLTALDRALAEIDTAAEGVRTALVGLDIDPLALDRVTERLFALREVARKYGLLPDDLPELTANLDDQVSAIEHGADDLVAAQAELDAAQVAYDTAAGALSAARRAAAARLDAAVMAELAPLRMERAVFSTDVQPAEPGLSGIDAVAFRVATNPGAPSGPLERIASGGELSRFLLALKVCLATTSPRRTMIFDEIDRGVGGATADAVGRRLAALAASAQAGAGQVLVVTHSPQVAALGAHHWRVEKHVDGDETRSTVVPLPPKDRVDEIARMLAGDRVTAAARAAAQALLAETG
ncbi:MAG: DNA repair protein RecN [Rhodobacteraceae bacterium]|nr:DNA repair protein RecN [Paracoccaceae bacterium]